MFRPQKGKQEKFLACSADICIYGGAAGGGKSYALLLEPLRHIGNKQFAAVTFRRTNPQILSPGGLWSESFNIYQLAWSYAEVIPKADVGVPERCHDYVFALGDGIDQVRLARLADSAHNV